MLGRSEAPRFTISDLTLMTPPTLRFVTHETVNACSGRQSLPICQVLHLLVLSTSDIQI